MTTEKIKYTKYLKKLGVTKLKKEQKEIINAVLNNRDSVAVLPTGFGKSLTYVLPHILLKRNVLIISPLVSLIRDQVLAESIVPADAKPTHFLPRQFLVYDQIHSTHHLLFL